MAIDLHLPYLHDKSVAADPDQSTSSILIVWAAPGDLEALVKRYSSSSPANSMEAPSLAPASEAVTEALALPFLVVPDAVAREGNRLSPTAFGKLPLNNIELEDFDAPDNEAATGAVHLSSPSSTSAAPGTEETKVLNRPEMCSCAFDR